MDTLPKDMMNEILYKLEGKDLIRMWQIDKRMRNFCDDKLWTMKIKQLFSNENEEEKDPQKLKKRFKIKEPSNKLPKLSNKLPKPSNKLPSNKLSKSSK